MPSKDAASESLLRRALGECRGYFVTAGTFSFAINLLYLSSALYSLQVYDRVMPSGSAETLVMLTLMLVLAVAALAGLDTVRSRVLTRAGLRLDQLLATKIVAASVEGQGDSGSRSQPLRDFDVFRQTITGSGIHALFDLPWAPIYLAVIFLLHPLLGAFALGSAVLIVALAGLNELATRRPLREANEVAARNYGFTEMGLRNAEVLRAMAMTPGLLRRWARDRNRVLERQTLASDRAGALAGLVRFVRLCVQSLVLGLGAWLAIQGMTTSGTLFAAGLLLGRALQPVEQMVASWRHLVEARAAYGRVGAVLERAEVGSHRLTLPQARGTLLVEGLFYTAPQTQRPLLKGLNFRVEAGETLGVIGPSGAGKSTLARTLVGVLRPSHGAVRLDGAELGVWPSDQLGRQLGYLPQDIELFADTVAANIGRFETGADEDIVKAAQLAGVHEMILKLPDGYNTQVGEAGGILSGGYRQRIALARAVFGVPGVVILDEPSSNLDAEGDLALTECAHRLKQLGTTLVIVSHRPATLGTVDKILLLREGVGELFGPRDEVLAKLNQRVQAASPGGAGIRVA